MPIITLTRVGVVLPPEEQAPDMRAAVPEARKGSLSLVCAHGPLGPAAGGVHETALMELAEAPAGVICDLSDVSGPYGPSAVSLLAGLGAHARHWPGTPVGVLCPDDALERELRRKVVSQHLQIAADPSLLWRLVSARAATASVRAVLAPTARAPLAARDLVSRACLDWNLGSQIRAATLVVSELVSNAMVQAGTDLEVSIVRCDPRLRIAVKNHSIRPPHRQEAGASEVTGPGPVLADALCESWGALHTVDGGKVVWAVILEGDRPGAMHTLGERHLTGKGSYDVPPRAARVARGDTPQRVTPLGWRADQPPPTAERGHRVDPVTPKGAG